MSSDVIFLEVEAMKIKTSDKITMENKRLLVNGKPFTIEYPDEPLWDIEGNQLVTIFRGHLYNYWNLEDVRGYFE